MDKLSLFQYCQKCNATCCKVSTQIGAPILSEQEAEKIKSSFGAGTLKVIRSSCGEIYYLPNDKKEGCVFLKNNYCLIQHIKPMDCLCYPIKAVYRGNKIIYVIDNECPALPHLSSKFIQKAKIIALQSIKRFQPETYNHWLENYIGWVRGAQILK